MRNNKKDIAVRVLCILAGAAILSFGIHNIHERTNITEGGVLGLMLLINEWFGISPAYVTPVIDLICYGMAFKLLGASFIKWSVVSTASISMFYKVWESFPYMLPDLSGSPLIAAVLGGICVGVGAGIIVRMGGSSGGDDALALSISHVTGWKIAHSYLITDISVLLLSLSYIPLGRIIYSLITVTISSNLIDMICGRRKQIPKEEGYGLTDTETE